MPNRAWNHAAVIISRSGRRSPVCWELPPHPYPLSRISCGRGLKQDLRRPEGPKIAALPETESFNCGNLHDRFIFSRFDVRASSVFTVCLFLRNGEWDDFRRILRRFFGVGVPAIRPLPGFATGLHSDMATFVSQNGRMESWQRNFMNGTMNGTMVTED